MKTLMACLIILLLSSCRNQDKRTWESDTNGPPANMATCNADIDESKWPPDNRTGNPAYHLRKEKELTARLKSTPEKPDQ